VLLDIIIATFVDSLVGLVGALSLLLRPVDVQKLVNKLVAFAAGTMIGGAMLHLLPEAAEMTAFSGEFAVVGFLLFFLTERVLHWKHCHDVDCEHHPLGWLIVTSDGVHNFVDGLVIASAFLVDVGLGWVTTLAIIAHEVPQEIGDFAVMVHGGFSRGKATFWNFVSQCTCILGGLIGFLFGAGFESFLVPFAAGGFIYIAAVDLIPELHPGQGEEGHFGSFLLFLLGVLLMAALKFFLKI
jgi:zinc and cadmium transporter